MTSPWCCTRRSKKMLRCNASLTKQRCRTLSSSPNCSTASKQALPNRLARLAQSLPWLSQYRSMVPPILNHLETWTFSKRAPPTRHLPPSSLRWRVCWAPYRLVMPRILSWKLLPIWVAKLPRPAQHSDPLPAPSVASLTAGRAQFKFLSRSFKWATWDPPRTMLTHLFLTLDLSKPRTSETTVALETNWVYPPLTKSAELPVHARFDGYPRVGQSSLDDANYQTGRIQSFYSSAYILTKNGYQDYLYNILCHATLSRSRRCLRSRNSMIITQK